MKKKQPKNWDLVSESEAHQMMDILENNLRLGWSINMAMLLATGTNTLPNRYSVAIGKTQRYLDILNDYCREKNKMAFARCEITGKIIQVSRNKSHV